MAAAIAGRARRYNFSTDASQRFERGVDASTTVEHIEYLTALILRDLRRAGGPGGRLVTGLPERKPVGLRIERARKVIGVPPGRARPMVAYVLTRLQLPHRREGDSFVVEPPPHRFDLLIEEDLIEEVARLYGFERLPARPPQAATPMHAAPEGSAAWRRSDGRWPHATTRRWSPTASCSPRSTGCSGAGATRSRCSTRSPRRWT